EAAIPTDVPQSEFAEQLHAKLKKALASYDQTRNVTVVFIILSDFNVTTIAEDVNLKKLQAAMNAIVKSIHKYQGCLRQINCDDKSLTALLVWGLPGFAHEKDEALFAVPAAMDIRSRLSKILRSNFSIGVTSGSVFAGIVGNTNRADGTVLGVSVNNAARIMCLDMCRGSVLVDSTVFEIASSIFEFDEDIEEVYLKGAGHRKIYRPIKKRAEKNIENTHKRNVWGRDRELAAIGEVISAWKTHNKQRLVITGPSGAGKTMLMNYCLQSLSHDPTTIFWVSFCYKPFARGFLEGNRFQSANEPFSSRIY
ncbi:nucleotide cyclase, partial [Chytriomyces sp. MP71]